MSRHRDLSGRALLLVGGAVVLGVGVALLLAADLGSDGFSTLVNGTARATGWPFALANLLVSVAFLLLAATRRLFPGVGTVVQVLLVGVVVSVLLPPLERWDALDGLVPRVALLVLSLPVLATGIACYLGSRLGAGPIESAALAWDPPVPFRWSYTAAQGASAVVGWLLGGTLGVGTVAVVVLLGPLVDLVSRRLHLDVHQSRG
ncbi:Uncharacterized membrane protein YczE [Nocardioides scoriae]|uniref:Uncharacterized membrane protein YczE n=1 Tax=Nocardioides scoriae TaxID=642780 RepID=A0A1H1T6A1_9ACTN|nr:hypothetical protein [Nocardioides scoriae]SDS55718.1 Uncharacterized membrane protein YczE [Nocardioides scoriae]